MGMTRPLISIKNQKSTIENQKSPSRLNRPANPTDDPDMRHRSHRRGVATIYAIVIMTVLLGIASLAVDFGRVQVAKAELQRAADAAARYGVVALSDDRFSNPVGLARQWAKDAANDNLVDGRPLVLKNQDIEFIQVDPTTKNYVVLTGNHRRNANGLRILPKLTDGRGNSVPLMFGWIAGLDTMSITSVTSTIYVVPRIDWNQEVPATRNPWLAGMPNGTVANPGNPHNNPDYAGLRQYYKADGSRNGPPMDTSPMLVTNLPIVPGQPLNFAQIGGTANHLPSDQNFAPDGNTSFITDNFGGAENGMANLRSPINALVGVFLSDGRPDRQGSPPSTLDFTTPQSRNFQTLSPQLRQPFFIGDGKDDNGNPQNFVIPAGATRLYLGIMDGYEWNNNQGVLNPTATRPKTIIVIK